MTNVAAQKRQYSQYVHVIIMMALILFFKYVPPIGALTPLGMQTLGIFAGVVYGWSTVGMIFPRAAMILAFGFLGENTVLATLGAAFGDQLTLIVLFFFLVSTLVSEVGLSNYIAQWCVSRKFVVGKPWGIAVMFCIASAIIAATVNLYAAMFLMWNIFYSFCDQAGFKPGDKYPMLVLVAILYSCVVAGGIFPYMGLAIMVVAQLQSFLGLEINYFLYTVMQLFLVFISIGAYILIAKYIFRPDVSLILHQKDNLNSNEELKLTNHQKLVSGLILLLIVMLFLPELLPTSIAIIGFFKALGITGVALAVLILYYVFMLGHEDVVPITKLAQGLSWDMIFMFATIAPLSKAINNPDAGILTFINESMSSLLAGMSPFVFIVVLFFVSSCITQFANNAVVMSVIGPIMYTLGDAIQVNPYVLTVLAVPFLSVAFMTPAASVPAAMAFSNKEWIGTKNAYKMGAVIFMVNMLMLVVGIPVAELLF